MLDQIIRAALRECSETRKFPGKHGMDFFAWPQTKGKEGL